MSGEGQAIDRASFTLSEIAAATGGALDGASPSLRVAGVTTDSRVVAPGSLYVALRGERFDGHDFLADAARAGAAAALVEKAAPAPAGLPVVRVADTQTALGDLAAAHRRRFDVPLVAVTGSYGKTTTRALTAAALSPGFSVLAATGNFNNEIGLPLTLLRQQPAHTAVVVEFGMRGAGQIDYLARIACPTVGVVTTIGPQHIELLGSLENIAAAKAELLHALPRDGLAVLPADDAFLSYLRESCACRAVTFGAAAQADYRVTEVHATRRAKVRLTLIGPRGTRTPVDLPWPGLHNAHNAAAALAVAIEVGIAPAAAAAALQSAVLPAGRMRIVRAPGLTIIDDSYNAGPDSMRAALATLRDWPTSGRRVAVLGAMLELGAWAQEEHRKIGALAGEFVGLLIAVGEEARDIEAVARAEKTAACRWFADAASAAAIVPGLLREGDVVLVKGSRSVGLEQVVSALSNV